MNDDRIQIKGTKEGINATIDMERFSDFDEMLEVLIDKLTAGKGFYKGASLKIAANLKNVNENDILRLKFLVAYMKEKLNL